MSKIIHPLAGALALLMIATFWLTTVFSELFATKATVISIKTAIPFGFLLLVPAMAAAGGSGIAMTKGRRPTLIQHKMRRMRIIAANGILILIPSALFLASRARGGELDSAFYAVQGLELVAGAINISLLALNMRDGFRLKGRFRRPPNSHAPSSKEDSAAS